MSQPQSMTIVDILQQRFFQEPERQIFTFLLDGENLEVTWTYRDLFEKSKTIGFNLQNICSQGDRILLVHSPGIEIMGSLYGALCAGMVVVPVSPPDHGKFSSKFEAIAEDSKPSAILTDSSMAGHVAIQRIAEKLGIQVVLTDTLEPVRDPVWTAVSTSPSALALVQYTSGSTSLPKGVMVTHTNLVSNQESMHRAFPLSSDDVIVNWLPYFHDMGLIGNLFHAVYTGVHCVSMSPAHFIRRPARWLQAISRYRGTASGGPNFAYELCLSRVSEEERRGLDLSSWRWAYSGAETIRADTLNRFVENYQTCGFKQEAFRPCYGLAESTLFVSGLRYESDPLYLTISSECLQEGIVVPVHEESSLARKVVNCGRILDGRLAIVDPAGKELPSLHIGEIWISSSSVAAGYWNRVQENQNLFEARLESDVDQSFLRTGDLGFMYNNQLYLTGRLKDLIVIRGRNFFPSDIEFAVREVHNGLRGSVGAAFSIDTDEGEVLVVVQEIPRPLRKDAVELIARIRHQVVTECGVEAYAIVLVRAGSLPKTTSNKVQRGATRLAFLSHTLEVIASNFRNMVDEGLNENDCVLEQLTLLTPQERKTQIEWLLRKRLAHLLNTSPSAIEPEQSLSVLGMDSLIAVDLLHTMERTLGVRLPLAQLFGDITISSLAADLSAAFKDANSIANRIEMKPVYVQDVSEYSPLTPSQKAIWLLQEMEPDNTSYSIARALHIRQVMNTEALRRAFRVLVARHEILRSRIVYKNGELYLQPNEISDGFLFQVVDASSYDEPKLLAQLQEEARIPFDLGQGPLLRIVIYEIAVDDFILFFNVHHCVADFWSITVMLRELELLYNAEQMGTSIRLPRKNRTYKDYAYWQSAFLNEAEGQRQLKYWENRLADKVSRSLLPTDLPRSKAIGFEGSLIDFEIDPAVVGALNRLAIQNGTTLYVVMLSALKVLLLRYTGEEQIQIGTSTFGRSRLEFADVVGHFVNLVVMSTNLSGDPSFLETIERVKQTVHEGLEHGDYPFPLLVERLQPDRAGSRTPFADIFFAYQTAPGQRNSGLELLGIESAKNIVQVGPFQVETIPLDQGVTRFDLDLAITRSGSKLVGYLKYSTQLFKRQTMVRFLQHYLALLTEIVEKPEMNISSLDMMSLEEQEHLLKVWSRGTKEYPSQITLHGLFENQAKAYPQRIAVVDQEISYTYEQVFEMSSKLANLIKEIELK